jgi:hypothetical protein
VRFLTMLGMTASTGAMVAATGLALTAPATAAPAGSAFVPPAAISGSCPDGSRIRRSPSTSAAVLGLCYSTHRVVIHCAGAGSDSHVWGNVTDQTTGVSGWSAIGGWGLGGIVTGC